MLTDITPAIHAAMTAVNQCGEYSRQNPAVPLERNPFDAAATATMIAAFGDAAVVPVCEDCRTAFPTTLVNPDDESSGLLVTLCCGTMRVDVLVD